MTGISNSSLALMEAASATQIELARTLFLEYARSLNFSLCFQSFDEELRTLPGAYAPPRGKLLLAMEQDLAAGCIALRPLDAHTCEMKRLYVRPGFRGKGAGRLLVDGVIAAARSLGYERMRLDTVADSMQDAIALYRRRGFREIPPYCANPVPGALYLELLL